MRRMLDPKELGGGGGKLYRHTIAFLKPNLEIHLDVYSTIPQSFTFPEFKASIKNKATCTGVLKFDNIQGQPVTIYYRPSTEEYIINYITNGSITETSTKEGSVSLIDNVTAVE